MDAGAATMRRNEKHKAEVERAAAAAEEARKLDDVRTCIPKALDEIRVQIAGGTWEGSARLSHCILDTSDHVRVARQHLGATRREWEAELAREGKPSFVDFNVGYGRYATVAFSVTPVPVPEPAPCTCGKRAAT